MTRGRLATEVDRVVVRHDRDGCAGRGNRPWIVGSRSGTKVMAPRLGGLLVNTHAAALDTRLDALAGTVCPTTRARRINGAPTAWSPCGRPGSVGLPLQETRQCGGPAPTEPRGGDPYRRRAGHDRGPLGEAGISMGPYSLFSVEMVDELAEDARQRPLLFPPMPGRGGVSALAGVGRIRAGPGSDMSGAGGDRAATLCRLDHTIPWPGGPTHAGNLDIIVPRCHQLLKTFGAGATATIADGTLIWRLPGGQRYITTPGSALLFPELDDPTASRPGPGPSPDRLRVRAGIAASGYDAQPPRLPEDRTGPQAITAERRLQPQQTGRPSTSPILGDTTSPTTTPTHHPSKERRRRVATRGVLP